MFVWLGLCARAPVGGDVGAGAVDGTAICVLLLHAQPCTAARRPRQRGRHGRVCERQRRRAQRGAARRRAPRGGHAMLEQETHSHSPGSTGGLKSAMPTTCGKAASVLRGFPRKQLLPVIQPESSHTKTYLGDRENSHSFVPFSWFFFQIHQKIKKLEKKREIMKNFIFIYHLSLQISPSQNFAPAASTIGQLVPPCPRVGVGDVAWMPAGAGSPSALE